MKLNYRIMFLIKYLLIVCMSVFIFIGCTNKGSVKNDDSSIDMASISDEANEEADNVVDERGYIVEVGDIAPDFEMALPNGERVQLSSLRGKVVMLQFTASWCGVCRKEMPYIEKDI